MSKRFLVPVIATLIATPIIATPVLAADPAGEAVKVLATTRAQGSVGERFLEARGAVFQGDLITTNTQGEAQLRFVDDTRLVVGPNSRVTIEEI